MSIVGIVAPGDQVGERRERGPSFKVGPQVFGPGHSGHATKAAKRLPGVAGQAERPVAIALLARQSRQA